MANNPALLSLKERQRQERERLILDAAEALILEKGYYEMAMEDIAQRVGIAKGTVYLHFASKEALVAALLERNMQAYIDTITAILDAAQSPRAKLQAILMTTYERRASRHFQTIMALAEATELRNFFLEKKAMLQTPREQLNARMRAVLAEGQAMGEFDATMPTSVLLNLFWSMLIPHNFDQRAPDQVSLDLEALSAHMIRFFFKGIAANAPPERNNP